MKCDICGSDAVLHITDGTTVLHHYCEAHAGDARAFIPSNEQVALSLIPQLRSIADFIRSKDRMPTPDEMEELGAVGSLAKHPLDHSEIGRCLAYLEQLAAFIECHKRLPTEEELPEAF